MILVTGGTGFVGRHLVSHLRRLGHPVRVLVRPKNIPKWIASEGATPVVGDILNPDSLLQAMEDVSTVVHLVGIIAETKYATFDQIHVEGTRNVVTAAKTAGARRYLHMSALGTRPHARSKYHQTKWAAEEIVRASSLEWTIFRPSLIYGPDDHLSEVFLSMTRFPLGWLQLYGIPCLGGGENRVQPVSADEVASAFTLALTHSNAIGKTYDLCGPEPLLFRDFLKAILEAHEIRSRYEPIPWSLLFRKILWAFVFLWPIGIVIFGVQQNWPAFAVSLTLWLAGLIATLRRHKIILFSVPWPIAYALGFLLEKVPHAPLTLGQVLMLEEDNTGNNASACHDLGWSATIADSGKRISESFLQQD